MIGNTSRYTHIILVNEITGSSPVCATMVTDLDNKDPD